MWKSKLNFSPIMKIEAGQAIEGVYGGSRRVEKISSLLHKIEVAGISYDIYGCGSLDAQLKDIDEGTKVKILYSGKKSATVQIGGKAVKKDVHNYVVYTEVNEA